MGKDREGTYHPPKGKPSGAGKQKGLVTPPTDSKLEEHFDIEDKYTIGSDADTVAPNVRLRHPNRNVDKGENRKQSDNKNNASDKSRNETFTEEQSTVVPEELSEALSKQLLEQLAAYKSDCCVSLYIPTHRSGVDVNEQSDIIVFKNAVQQLTTDLKEKGFAQTAIARMLEPAYDLLRNDNFWLNLTPGLACFIADDFFKYIKLPSTPDEKSVINSSFYLSPLVPLITAKEYFYLLVISKKQAKLFRADNFGMKYIALKELPNGVDDVVHFEEKEDQKLFRTGSSGAGTGANYHGIGAGKPDEKEHISIYLEEVDDTLWKEVLHTENVPLLLAGVEYLIPIYKKVTDYGNVWDASLTGSLENEDERVLYKQAREIMEPYFQERTNKAIERYGNQSATALTSSVPADIIPAAYYSRVAYLFVQKDAELWGTFDEDSNTLSMHESQEQGDESLLDKAVLKTILNGGEVYILEKERMPADSKLAAIMRY